MLILKRILIAVMFCCVLPVIVMGQPEVKLDYSESGEGFEDAIRDISSWAADFIERRGERNLAADYHSLPGFPGGAKSAFFEHLRTHLKPRNLTLVQRNSNLRLITSVAEAPDGTAGFRLRSEIRDRSGDIVASMDEPPIFVSKNADAAHLAGINIALKPGGNIRQQIQDTVAKRVLWLSSNATTAYEGSEALFGLSIESQGRRIPIIEGAAGSEEEGFGFVELALGQEYKIWLTNNADFSVAADLRVDGISVFHFCEPGSRKPDGGPRYWIIPPKSSMSVAGWYKTPERANAFKTSVIPESAVAQANLPLDDIGQIGATFSASWEEGKSRPPQDEPEPIATTYSKTKSLGTAQGRELSQRTKDSNVEVGKSRGYVGVRYRREN